MNQIQQLLKAEGLSKLSINKSLELLEDKTMSISALLSKGDNIKQQFEAVSMMDVQDWKRKNVGETLEIYPTNGNALSIQIK